MQRHTFSSESFFPYMDCVLFSKKCITCRAELRSTFDRWVGEVASVWDGHSLDTYQVWHTCLICVLNCLQYVYGAEEPAAGSSEGLACSLCHPSGALCTH